MQTIGKRPISIGTNIKLNITKKNYYAKNADEIRSALRKLYASNPESRKRAVSKWCAANPGAQKKKTRK